MTKTRPACRGWSANLATFLNPTGFEVPGGLARNVAEDDEDGAARRAWLEALPRTVADLAARWSLEVARSFSRAGTPPGSPRRGTRLAPGRLAGDPAGFANRMAGLLGLDAGRVRSWLFARWRLRRKHEARRQLIVSIRQPTPALRANFSSQVTSVALSFSASAA